MKKLIALLFLFPSIAFAQPAPSFYPGCVYVSTLPTLTNLQTTTWHCDVNGKLITSNAASGITINTSTITGGTNTRILFDDNGVVGENGNLLFLKSQPSLVIGAYNQVNTTSPTVIVYGGQSITNWDGNPDGSSLTIIGPNMTGTSGPASANSIINLTIGHTAGAVGTNSANIGWVQTGANTGFGFVDTYCLAYGTITEGDCTPQFPLMLAGSLIQIGPANSTTPTAQTMQFQNGSGTNIAAVNATINCPLGTGTGTNGDCLFYTGTKTISGTTAATKTLALTIKGETQAMYSAGTIASASAISPTAKLIIYDSTGTAYKVPACLASSC